MKYIPAEKLIAEIERLIEETKSMKPSFDQFWAGQISAFKGVLKIIDSLQQEQPEGNLEYWLEHFGMPKENIDNCITQIAQGYGACRYLEGIQHGAEAVNELAQQEQQEVDLWKEIHKYFNPHGMELQFDRSKGNTILKPEQLFNFARHFYELGLNVKKEE